MIEMKIERAKRQVWAKSDRPAYTADISMPQQVSTDFINPQMLDRAISGISETVAKIATDRDVAMQHNLTTRYRQLQEEFIKDLQLCKNSDEVAEKRKMFDAEIEEIKQPLAKKAGYLLTAWQDKVGRHLDKEVDLQQGYIHEGLLMAERQAFIVDDVSRQVNIYLSKFMSGFKSTDKDSSSSSDEKKNKSNRAIALANQTEEAEKYFKEYWFKATTETVNGKKRGSHKILSEEERNKYSQLFMNMLDKARVQADIYGTPVDYLAEGNTALVPQSSTADPAGALTRLQATDKNGKYLYYKGLVGEERLKYIYEAMKWSGSGWGGNGSGSTNKFYNFVLDRIAEGNDDIARQVIYYARRNELTQVNSYANAYGLNFTQDNMRTGLNEYNDNAKISENPKFVQERARVNNKLAVVRGTLALNDTKRGEKPKVWYLIDENGKLNKDGKQAIDYYISQRATKGKETAKLPWGNDKTKESADTEFNALCAVLGTDQTYYGNVEKYDNFRQSTLQVAMEMLNHFSFDDSSDFSNQFSVHPLKALKNEFSNIEEQKEANDIDLMFGNDVKLKMFILEEVAKTVVGGIWNNEGKVIQKVFDTPQPGQRRFIDWYRNSPDKYGNVKKEDTPPPEIEDYIEWLRIMAKKRGLEDYGVKAN